MVCVVNIIHRLKSIPDGSQRIIELGYVIYVQLDKSQYLWWFTKGVVNIILNFNPLSNKTPKSRISIACIRDVPFKL